MRQPIFRGSAVAIITPFTQSGEIDYPAFGKLIDWQIEQGTQALIVMGTTGENPVISDEEFVECVGFAIRRAKKRIPMVIGTGRNDTRHSIKLSKLAKELGADALLVTTPYYNKTTQAGLIQHIKAIADSTDLPIILYNVPSRTGMGFAAETYAELAKIPTVNGVKEAGSDFTLILRTLKKCPKDFYIYSGNDDQTTAMMALGAVGVISVLGNIAPKEVQQICKYALDRNFEASAKMLVDYCDLIDALFIETNPIPVKAAAEAMGLCGGTLRMPLIDMSEKNRPVLFDAMKKHGLLK